MLKYIDHILNSLTMYRVVLYGLTGIAFVSVLMSLLGLLPHTPVEMIASLIVLGTSCYLTKEGLARILKAPTNVESSAITSLILFLIAAPTVQLNELAGLALLGAIAMASKFFLTWKGAHVFNPVAIAAVLLGTPGIVWINWWVGSAVLLPFTLILGLLILRKTRRETMFLVFFVTAVLTITLFQNPSLSEPLVFARELITAWPLIFFGTVMLTEPLTMPATNRLQILYAGLIGILVGTPYKLPPLFSTPELALVLGNAFAFLLVPRWQGKLAFLRKEKIGTELYQFWFERPHSLSFTAGQYMEWTLPHTSPDERGNRRYLTLASSPTEPEIGLGVRIPPNASSFKKALVKLKPGEPITAAQVSGDFTLLETAQHSKLVFIAGGIGITPYRSMIQYLLDTHGHTTQSSSSSSPRITLLYACSHPDHFAYSDLFVKAQKQLPFTFIPIITRKQNIPKNWHGETGYISQEMIQACVPDWAERQFYLSGPNSLVDSTDSLLRSMGVSTTQIKKDYFPGY